MTTRFVVCGETLIDLIQADDQPEGFVQLCLVGDVGGRSDEQCRGAG